MSVLLNETGIIGQILNYGTINVTGSIFITILMIFILFVAIGLMFRMPIEWIAILILPLAIIMLAMDSLMLGIVATILIFFSYLFVKNVIPN